MEDRASDQREWADAVCIQSGSLDQCEVCGVTQEGSGEIEPALALAKPQFDKGELRGLFDTWSEVAGAIRVAINEHPFECKHAQFS